MKQEYSKEQEVLRRLTSWVKEKAKEKRVPEYMILPHTTINAIAQSLPTNKESLVLIPGIKESKFREFGEEILSIVKNHDDAISHGQGQSAPSLEALNILPVGAYLNLVNQALKFRTDIRVIGEVGQVKMQGNALYFTLKDEEDGSSMSIFMWKNTYQMFGVELIEGMRVTLGGSSEVYKPAGRLNFRAESIELVGEGALKASYEKLKKDLTKEGLFSEQRKRELPVAPRRVGIITSKTGAVIHDFLNNLDRRGVSALLVDSRVEGALATRDILNSINVLRAKEIDLLVLIRGGGSLESLQAFNNESIVRAVSNFPVPVICSIGHHEDTPLAQLAADLAPSTPTACAVAINEQWNKLEREVEQTGQDIVYLFENILTSVRGQRYENILLLTSFADRVSKLVYQKTAEVAYITDILANATKNARVFLYNSSQTLLLYMSENLKSTQIKIDNFSQYIENNDPKKLLQSGYAFAISEGRLLRTVKHVVPGSIFQLNLSDGTIDANVIKINQNHEEK